MLGALQTCRLLASASPERAGLLLNNLSVYRGCEVLFDSLEVPEDAIDEAIQHDGPEIMVGCSGSCLLPSCAVLKRPLLPVQLPNDLAGQP